MHQYSKPLTLHRGVDNQLQFQFLNQEQKPVNITGKEIVCRILNHTGDKILLSKLLTIQFGATGIALLLVNSAELTGIDAQRCYYSLEIPDGTFNFPVYVDQAAGGRGMMNIVDSVLPSFIPSNFISVPTSQTFPDEFSNSSTPAVTFFSSVLNTIGASVVTLQANYTAYTGNVTIQGSVVADTDWYDISTVSYANVSGTEGYTVHGYHPYIRVEFYANTGSVTTLLSR